ncbi:hypothetical protein [Segnochrobactrum spirostomi]|uniref:Uncharacterized protein n=1 Tax=Segnochrobactrum spirostomi TaxID=2608987 RepID=A0A6A7XZE7_9HYPH|nr:hypothetical protein [Segnochrobactrum spirostomi]MQT11923.1 hypothetical protein [Segnochrobactrum spirostomi]
MARRSRRRRRSSGGSHVVGIVLIVVALAALGGLGAFYFLTPKPPALDRATLCPLTGPRGVTVVLVDASDALPDVTRAEITTKIEDMAKALPPYDLLELRLLDPGSAGGKVVFSRCNPGDGKGASEFTANPELLKHRWEADFSAPLEKALSGGLALDQSETSPIIATIQEIAVQRFAGAANEAIPKHLVVVSDMLENAPGYSQYKGDLTYERFRASPVYRKLHTDLDGAEVTILYVQRKSGKKFDDAAHIKFWTDWIDDNGGRLDAAERLQGEG